MKGLRGIYRIICNQTGNFYIGSTGRCFDERKRSHFNKLRKGNHHAYLMQEEFNKYGETFFEFEIMESTDEFKNYKLEQTYIEDLNPQYNVCSIVLENNKAAFDSRKKVSESRGGKPFEVYKDGILLNTFDFLREAIEEYDLVSSGISGVLSGRCSQHRGYKFKYVGEDFKFVKKPRVPWNKGNKNYKRPTKRDGVIKRKDQKLILAKKDGIEIVFFSATDFCKYTGEHQSRLSKLNKIDNYILKGYEISEYKKHNK